MSRGKAARHLGENASIGFPFEAPPAVGAAIEVAAGVFWLRMPLPMALDHVNVYAFADEEGWTLIDTGFANATTREAWALALAGPLAGRKVARVIATHHHPDHIGLAGHFQSAHGAELWTTRTAWLYARMLQLELQERPDPVTLAFWRAAGMAPEIYNRRAEERPWNSADSVAPLPLGYRRIREGEALSFGGRRWIARMGDGHAPEHLTLWSQTDSLVIGGDQLLPGISANLGVYASEPEADPVGDWIASCERLAPHARDEQLVLPGHKLPFTGLPVRLRQMIDNHHGALARLEIWLEEPRRASDCFPALFKRSIGPAEYGLALVESLAHLNHLQQAGRARRWMDPDGAWRWQRQG